MQGKHFVPELTRPVADRDLRIANAYLSAARTIAPTLFGSASVVEADRDMKWAATLGPYTFINGLASFKVRTIAGEVERSLPAVSVERIDPTPGDRETPPSADVTELAVFTSLGEAVDFAIRDAITRSLDGALEAAGEYIASFDEPFDSEF